MDEAFYDDYKEALLEIIDSPISPIVYNLNVGHATQEQLSPSGPRPCRCNEQVIRFDYNKLRKISQLFFYLRYSSYLY